MIFNEAKLKQPILYEGIRVAYPGSDIDHIRDFHFGSAFIVGEVKTKGTSMPRGQQFLFNSIRKSMSVPCVTYLAYHEVYDPEVPIHLEQCILTNILTNEVSHGDLEQQFKGKSVNDLMVWMTALYQPKHVRK